MDLAAVRDELDALRDDSRLLVERNIGLRAAALDLAAFVEEIGRWHRSPEVNELCARARALRQTLQAIDERLLARLRAEVQSGQTRPSEWRERVAGYADPAPDVDRLAVPYDGLDVLLDGLLIPGAPPQAALERGAEMIHLDLTPGRVILSLVERLSWGSEDVFVDLGSGLGQVAMAVHLMTGVRARGVERDPAYCAYAREAARALRMSEVSFVQADVRAAPLEEGTVFFMFTPFVGQLLLRVLEKLRAVATIHPIRLGSYGPCTSAVAEQSWLDPLEGHSGDPFELALFASG